MLSSAKNIVLCWLPSHIGIEGNEKADLAARSALALPLSNIKLNCSNFKPLIFTFIRSRWQSCWDLADSNKLHSIKPTLGPCYSPAVTIRRDEVVLSRVRIGHTYLTHAFLLKGEDRPECVFCQCSLTVKHILIECLDPADARRNYFTAGTMEELFSTVPAHQIIEFLKEVERKVFFYHIHIITDCPARNDLSSRRAVNAIPFHSIPFFWKAALRNY